MEEYFRAKARLFEASFTDVAVIDVDTTYGRLLADSVRLPVVARSGVSTVDVLSVGLDNSAFRWRDQIVRLERALGASRASDERGEAGTTREDRASQAVRRTIAGISQREPNGIHGGQHLVDGLGFDSLMQLELLTALETEFPNARVTPDELSGASVAATVVGEAKGPKVTGFTYKNKTRSRRRWGHRQKYDTIEITGITVGASKK
jgi:large subunit ribosomal protein L21